MIPLGEYRHFKGGLYRVLHNATHTETDQPMVVYVDVFTNQIYVRPTSMFADLIISNEEIVPRFLWVGN